MTDQRVYTVSNRVKRHLDQGRKVTLTEISKWSQEQKNMSDELRDKAYNLALKTLNNHRASVKPYKKSKTRKKSLQTSATKRKISVRNFVPAQTKSFDPNEVIKLAKKTREQLQKQVDAIDAFLENY